MTRKRHVFDEPRVVVPTPPPVGKPTVAFQSPEIVALVGANVENQIFWESVSAGTAILTTSVPTLDNDNGLDLSSGTARWSKTGVGLIDSGQIQVDISDAGGAALDAFNLVVQAQPTISVEFNDVNSSVGDTSINNIDWTDDDASAAKPIASITANHGSIDQISDVSQTTGTARWILPNAQINDSHIVTIWITDGDGYVQSVLFQHNVTTAANTVPNVVVEPFSVELPIGSEAFLVFSTQDAETSALKPMTLFQILDGVTDVSADGVFSPLPADVTVPTAVSVGWSTTSQNLVDDGKVYTVRATDDDAESGEGATEVVFNVVDPLKTLSDHPVQRASAYFMSVAATATDPLRQLTGHPNPAASIWTTPTNAIWTANGVLLGGEGDSLVTTMTADASTQGAYTMRMRVDLNDFDTSVHLRATKNGTSIDNDYSYTGPTNLPAGTQLNIESFPIDLVTGDTLTLELWTERYNGAQILPQPPDNEKAIVSIMDLSTTSASEFPAGGGTLLYHWEMDQRSGIFTGPDQATYDAAVALLPVDSSSGRPKGDQSQGPSVGLGAIEWPINFEIPRSNPDGSIECFRELVTSSPPQGHCMLRAKMPGAPSTYVESGSYLKNGQEYEVETVFDVKGRNDAIGEGRKTFWIIIPQLHAGTYPNTWSGNPQLTFQLDDSEPQRVWKLHARGCTNPDPTAVNNYTDFFQADMANFWSGRHVCVMRYKQDWTGGAGSYLKVWWNGKLVVDESPISIGLNYSAVGGLGNASGQYTYGGYGFGSSDLPNGRPLVDLLKFSIRGL